MNCDEARVAAHEDLDGRLDVAVRPGYEAHLAACAGCRAHREGLSRVAAAFVASPLEGAPAGLLAGLGLGEAPVRPARRQATRGLPYFAGALAAAAVIAAVGLSLRTPTDPLLVAMSPSPAVEAGADAEAILTWFDADADYEEPVAF